MAQCFQRVNAQPRVDALFGGRFVLGRGFGVVFGDKLFSIQCRHTAHTRAGYGLTVDVIGQITGCKDAGHCRAGAAGFDFDIAAIVHLQRIFDQLVGRGVADGDKDAFGRDFGDLAGLDVL